MEVMFWTIPQPKQSKYFPAELTGLIELKMDKLEKLPHVVCSASSSEHALGEEEYQPLIEAGTTRQASKRARSDWIWRSACIVAS